MNRSPAAADAFIEALGLSIRQEGLPRIAGRMLALFIVYGGPLSFSGLADRLQVSRGSISSNARLLRQLGLIERFALPGDRQDYYRLCQAPYGHMLEGQLRRIEERLALVDTTLAALPAGWRDSRQRLSHLRDFYAAAARATTGLMQDFTRDGSP